MGRSAKIRKRKEGRFGDGITSGAVKGTSQASPSKRSSRPPPASNTSPASPSSSEALSEIVAEIVVWTDDMNTSTPSIAGGSGEVDENMLTAPQAPDLKPSQTSQHDGEPEQNRETFESSLSALSEHSDLSSVPSSGASSRATTPTEKDESAQATGATSRTQPPALPEAEPSYTAHIATATEAVIAATSSSLQVPQPTSLFTEVSTTTTPAQISQPTFSSTNVSTTSTPLQVPQPTSSLTELSTTPTPLQSATPSHAPTPAPAESSVSGSTNISASPAPQIRSQKQSPASTQPESAEYLTAPRRRFSVRPKSSIPSDLSPAEYAGQCIEAAENSRLNPFILHPEEREIVRDHLSYVQVTTYINIRNGILRLWIQNPRMAVTRDEAVGCAGARWANVASVCYDWLVRNGYINFGCLDIPAVEAPSGTSKPSMLKRKRVVVIGAGMAGLGCARQIEGLTKQYADRLYSLGELPPEVIVLEGRSRVGGRVYSRPFQSRPAEGSQFASERCTAEMGGMIITGFIGNPLNILVRGQLSLPYFALNPRTTIFDSDGQPVEEDRDLLVEKLYNDCLDRVSEYKFKTKPPKIIRGNRELILEGRDASNDGQKTIRAEEEAQPSLTPDLLGQAQMHGQVKVTAAQAAKSIGWSLRSGVSSEDSLDLQTPTSAPEATLGSVVDACISQYRNIVDLTDRDFRLLNWHIANLEYSNATNMQNLSLGGWDIDAGNEWVGKHTMIAGGYQRVARGLLHCPTKLDVRTNTPVRTINYHADASSGPATVVCEDGSAIEADYVISTIPLGVLKHGDIEFNPPLPDWKLGAIERLGFGVLNKVILVYDKPFWDLTRHIFGALRNPENAQSLDQADYRSQRGRFFQFLDVSNTSGLPCLVALMAGDAAVDTESASNEELVSEATEILSKIFGRSVPLPIEATVTRWLKDRFSRGSYSSSGPTMQPTDYDTMAKTVGNLYFAGEHTIGTHPATVHGAYLSGLRAASEILGSLIGEIEVPAPLLIPKESQSLKRKIVEVPKDPLDLYEEELHAHIMAKIGPRPPPPEKVSVNAYRLYCAGKQEVARQRCEADIRPGKRKGKAGPNEVRHMVSKMWKRAAPGERKPFEDMVSEAKRAYVERLAIWEGGAAEWDARAAGIREEYVREKPFAGGEGDRGGGGGEEGPMAKQRRKKMISYAEDSDGSDESDGEV
ncbi:related to VPS33 - vacuolar sorting protein [Cephalotrichum gorgonifer]|uniref:Related to VPS33 - vacuolar sorting protein n=1 Tax=Cephalotrichum gorgonifer TaxID=2041049 RepID=A0AAE8MNW6_9PEZI|nr:related to VPS33 - vacuolar sorting protein [Cephalotrichum gorgonifer]